MSSSSRNDSGFTLLEVLIAFVILAVISLTITQTIFETFKIRDRLSNEGDFHNTIRLSMSIMDRDISLLYSPILLLPKKKPGPGNPGGSPDNEVLSQEAYRELQQLQSSDLGQTFAFWGPAVDKNGLRPSRFVGTDTKMTFVSASNVRTYKDSKESDFAKVTYELQPDRSSTDIDVTARVLVKTESPNVFEEDDSRDKSKRSYSLLPGITRFKLEYYRKDKDTWLGSWDSENQDTKNLYPDMIRVTIEVKGPSRLFFEGRYQFRPEIPLRGLDPST